ncbi:collagen alpha-1(I) chain-like [Cynocephalus volans]|uniref:collagen alpha-1(I) chain-like n=1 Tax=Cynocephalus volans TaxID=110931 RepID=UPI002FCA546B
MGPNVKWMRPRSGIPQRIRKTLPAPPRPGGKEARPRLRLRATGCWKWGTSSFARPPSLENPRLCPHSPHAGRRARLPGCRPLPGRGGAAPPPPQRGQPRAGPAPAPGRPQGAGGAGAGGAALWRPRTAEAGCSPVGSARCRAGSSAPPAHHSGLAWGGADVSSGSTPPPGEGSEAGLQSRRRLQGPRGAPAPSPGRRSPGGPPAPPEEAAAINLPVISVNETWNTSRPEDGKGSSFDKRRPAWLGIFPPTSQEIQRCSQKGTDELREKKRSQSLCHVTPCVAVTTHQQGSHQMYSLDFGLPSLWNSKMESSFMRGTTHRAMEGTGSSAMRMQPLVDPEVGSSQPLTQW